MELNLQELNRTVYPIPADLQDNIAITSLSKLYNWGRRNSMWPMLFGLACCAIEMIATAASRYDFSRFGMEVMRATPRQADLMIVSGTVTKKMVVPIVRLYNQMPEPKYVMAMGACASGGGPFKEGYNVVSGIDKYLPVDVYVPGCPPTPQALLFGLIALQRKVDGQSLADRDEVPWYGIGSDPTPVPILGPDIIDPRQMDMIRRLAENKAAKDAEALPAGRALPVVKTAAAAIPAAAKRTAPAPAATAAPADDKRAAALARKALRAVRRGEGGDGSAAPTAVAEVSEETVVVAEAPAAPAKSAPVAAPVVTLAGGSKPWEEAEEIREQRKAAALARKAARAAKRDEGK